MRIVIDIPESKYLSLMKCFENDVPLGKTDSAIINGTPLPEGAEILTAEAYSDLCLRASNGNKTGRWKAKDFHTCYCTNCNFAFDIMKCDFMDKMRFCPNCGAKMEGAEK